MDDIAIKRLKTAGDYDQAVALQKTYWGGHAESLVAAHMLQSLSDHGGHVLGASHRGRLVGFVMGFLGTAIDWEAADARPVMSSLLIMSKRMLVLPAYRGRNIGFRLKMAQRQVALKQGIQLVTWTFDPMMSPNAHLNIRKLGAAARTYKINYFGAARPKSLQADRLVAEWRVTHRRVEERARGETDGLTAQQYLERGAARVNCAQAAGSWLRPAAECRPPTADLALVEIPADFRLLEAEEPPLAQLWRDHIRAVLPPILAAGFRITDFARGRLAGQLRAFYVLNRHLDGDEGRAYGI